MSLALNKIHPVAVLDPVMDINSDNYFAVLKGAKRSSWKPIISTSFSNSSTTFSAPPPSPDIVVGRHVKLKVPVTLDFTGTALAGNNLLRSGFDSFRGYPLSSVMNTLQIDLNNTSFSINMSDVIQGLLRYHNPDNLNQGDASMTPTYMDQTQSYNDIIGSVRNPLGYYGDSNAGAQMGRGGFPYTSFTNTPTTAQVQAELCEDLYLSPLLFGTVKQEQGFIGLQTLQCTINWNNDLTRMWSHASSSGTTDLVITVNLGQPTLLFEYKSPSILQILPSFRSYPYFEIQRYPTDAQVSISAQTSTTVSSSNIQLNSIPRIMYIYARKRNSDLTFEDTDTFFSIEGISINWANNSGLLSNATQQDLYEMSARNGCNLSWAQWSGQPSFLSVGLNNTQINPVGSVLGVEFGKDIGLDFDQAPGLNGTFQLQMEVQIKNISNAAITPALYIVIVNSGTFTLENNSAYSQVGVISKSDVINAQQMEGIDYNSLHYMAGASFVKDLKKGISKLGKKTFKVVKKVAPYVGPALSSALTAAKIAAMYGNSLSGGASAMGQYGSVLSSGASGLDQYGSALVGGRLPKKSELSPADRKKVNTFMKKQKRANYAQAYSQVILGNKKPAKRKPAKRKPAKRKYKKCPRGTRKECLKAGQFISREQLQDSLYD